MDAQETTQILETKCHRVLEEFEPKSLVTHRLIGNFLIHMAMSNFRSVLVFSRFRLWRQSSAQRLQILLANEDRIYVSHFCEISSDFLRVIALYFWFYL